jgi:hypothetical protein
MRARLRSLAGDHAFRRRLALVAVVCLGFLPPLVILKALWALDENGLSLLIRALPVWDFANLWGGARMATEGAPLILFDPPAYRAWFEAHFPLERAILEWSYPPSLLLLGVPLSLLPLVPAYLLWSGGTLALLGLTLRRAGLPLAVMVLTLLSPATVVNLIFGQNGALTAALLVGGLLLVERRPVFAGVLLGLLTIKPQLGLLVPICLVAAGAWRTIAAATLTAAALMALTALLFGAAVWPLFLTETQPMMRGILEAPYPQPYQVNGIGLFLTLRAAGAGVAEAYAGQALAALAAAALAWRLWRRRDADPALRMAATIFLTFLTTPYAYAYDMLSYSAALAVLIAARGLSLTPLTALLWLWPALTVPFTNNFFPATPLLMTAALWVAWRAASPASQTLAPPLAHAPGRH